MQRLCTSLHGVMVRQSVPAACCLTVRSDALRGLGIGQALLELLLRAAAARGDTHVYLHAQESAVSFYEPHGFIAEGEPYREAGIVHRTMRRAVLAV